MFHEKVTGDYHWCQQRIARWKEQEGRKEKHGGRIGRKKGQNDARTREVEWWIARRGNESEASDRRYTYQQCGAPVLRGPPRLSANTFLRVPSKLCTSTITDYFLLSWFRLIITAKLPAYVSRFRQFRYLEIIRRLFYERFSVTRWFLIVSFCRFRDRFVWKKFHWRRDFVRV